MKTIYAPDALRCILSNVPDGPVSVAVMITPLIAFAFILWVLENRT